MKTRFENKFINQAQQVRQANLKTKSKLIKMTSEAILLLNTLL